MANLEHVEVVKKGSESIAVWRSENATVAFDLSGADLPRADLSRADLYGADLSSANLSSAKQSSADLTDVYLYGANLSSANLSNADLRNANLYGANLSSANLSNADLRNANLIRADLYQANLRSADLRNANLTDSILAQCIFKDCDLRGADLTFSTLSGGAFVNTDISLTKGLETVTFRGPSSIGIDTLLLSQGNIPDVFLRGCGVPEDMITYLPSLIGSQSPIEFYSCFISYSHEDEEFCKRLHSRMHDEKLRVWYAPEDMPGGKKLHEEIDQAIRLHDKLLLVLSSHSIKSEWVETEVYKARMREQREGKRVLFPIRLVPFDAIKDWEAFNADDGKDMAREIREFFIPDFENWKNHDDFEQEFQRLLRDMKAESATKAK